MICKPITEFLLWNDCSQHGACAFCWQQGKHDPSKFLNESEKLNSIKCVKEHLYTHFHPHNNIKGEEQGNHILLVGGEIFDISENSVKESLKELFNIIVEYMNNDYIELFYINTNLIYSDTSLLEYLLDLLQNNNLLERLKFTTSWDLAGRFNIEEKQARFCYNLTKIKEKYPNTNIVVNSILTKQYCEHIIQNPNFVKDFQEEYKVKVNTIPYIVYCKWLEPTRDEVFDALLAIESVIPNYIQQYIDNFSLPQEKKLFEYNSIDKKLVYCSSGLDSCGHSENFKNYCNEKEKCFICDIKELANEITEN